MRALAMAYCAAGLGHGAHAFRGARPHMHLRSPRRALSVASVATDEWTVAKVRSTFIDYFVDKHQHTVVPSSAVVPLADATLLFTNSGMNQFKPIFLGQVSPDSPLAKLRRAANSQKCIRAGGKHNDLEDVGIDTYHHTFFEMLGSWSFGDYFKKEAVDWGYDLLINVYGLDPERLYATYFGGDASEGLEPDLEAKALWLQYLPESRVLPGSKQDNFWEMGDSGPCGPCSELHYDTLGGRGDVAHLVNADDATLLEVWNIVFMQFDRDARSRQLSALPDKHVDTGLGLERLVAILQRKTSNYDTDAFSPLFSAILAQLPAGAKAYAGNVGTDDADRRDTAYRAVADHVRCLSFALADGAVPSNEGRGYVLRRILRRGVRYGSQTLGAPEGFFARLLPALAESHFGEAYPELRASLAASVKIIEDEEATFVRTLARGVRYLDDYMAKAATKTVDGASTFFLYDSLGFPLDLTTLMAAEEGFDVDAVAFQEEMDLQKSRSRGDRATRRAKQLGVLVIDLGTAAVADLALAGVCATVSDHGAPTVPSSAILASYTVDAEGSVIKSAKVDGNIGLVLETSNFYAEGGGQCGDCGTFKVRSIEGETVQLRVRDTQVFAGYVLHSCEVDGGGDSAAFEIDLGYPATDLTVDVEFRKLTAPNHSMTHLLHHALRKVLGDGVQQRGSSVDAFRLRFDFAHGKALSRNELIQVERLVCDFILKDAPVASATVALDDVRQVPSLRTVAGENYPDPCRVVAIGCETVAEILMDPLDEKWQAVSLELCGGTHVSRTAEAMGFVIIEETAVAKGVRRIEAVTRNAAEAALATSFYLEQAFYGLEDADEAELPRMIKTFRDRLDGAVCGAVSKATLRDRLEKVQARAQAAQKARSAMQFQSATLVALAAANAAVEAGETRVVVALDATLDGKSASSLTLTVGKAHPGLDFFVLAQTPEDEDLVCFASVSAAGSDVDARLWVAAAMLPLGGKGGGKVDFAMGKAEKASQAALDEALELALAF